uniref:Cytochrome c domain-containing protein n=1 Tax=Parascaris univalens TaxID=6257 RepID=A0A914ZLM5_PARUN
MGDYERGKKLFMKRCAQCHVIDSIACINGPTLSGVIGRKSGTVDGYTHSEASTAKKVEDREDLITYIEIESKKPPKDAGQKWVKPQGHPLPKS